MKKKKWGTLKVLAMNSQVLAAAGDEIALSDTRAFIKSLHKKKIRDRWKERQKMLQMTMKTKTNSGIQNGFRRLAIIGLGLMLVGCKNSSPLTYSLATSTIVSYGLRNSPQTAGYLRDVQPVVCAAANGTNLSPAQIVTAIKESGIDDSAEGRLIVDGVLLIYISAFDSLGSKTNVAAVAPYSHAIFCEGFEWGLAGAPTAIKARNVPPARAVWPLLGKRK